MKKHLIAAAVAASFAAPAMAQNVTISGYLETGYQALSHNVAATGYAQDVTGIVGGIFGSSRLVIGGSEDLGGGLTAGFRLESSVDVANGRLGASTVGASAGAGTGEIFNRGAEVNLSGAFGMFRLGQFDHQGGENTDVNVAGNVALQTGITTANGTAAGVEIGTDRKSTIAYRTPTVNGLYIEAAHSFADGQKTSSTAESTNGAVSSVYAQYSAGPLEIRAGHATQKSMGTVTAANDDASRTGFGIKVDFGVASASLAYAKATLISQVKNDEVVASINIPMGNGLDLRGVYRNFDTDSAGATTTSAADNKEYTVAVAKAMSKRTSLFAAYTTNNRESSNATGGTDSTRYFLGVGHTF